jgi:hypothetical protein
MEILVMRELVHGFVVGQKDNAGRGDGARIELRG